MFEDRPGFLACAKQLLNEDILCVWNANFAFEKCTPALLPKHLTWHHKGTLSKMSGCCVKIRLKKFAI